MFEYFEEIFEREGEFCKNLLWFDLFVLFPGIILIIGYIFLTPLVFLIWITNKKCRWTEKFVKGQFFSEQNFLRMMKKWTKLWFSLELFKKCKNLFVSRFSGDFQGK